MLNGRQYLYPRGCQPDACVKKNTFLNREQNQEAVNFRNDSVHGKWRRQRQMLSGKQWKKVGRGSNVLIGLS